MNKKTNALTCLSAAGLLMALNAQAQEQHPNIIYVIADDLGYGDISCFGQQYFETPNIDRMAREGIRFTQHYAGCAVSAPSRSVLMSGLHMGHTSIRDNRQDKTQPEGQMPIGKEIITIPEMLKEAGYATGAFGKWGLGFIGTEGDPNDQGFDEFFGINCQVIAHRYYPTYLWHNREKVELPGNDWTHQVTYSMDVIHEKALEFIETNKDRPFFLFYPSTLPHAELIVPEDEIFEEMKKKFPNEKPYDGLGLEGEAYGPDIDIARFCPQEHPFAAWAAMITRLDKQVGEIIDKLEELGIEENTLIIFTSDNGPHCKGGADPDHFRSNGGFRGIKTDLYEGGIRIPFVAKWPGKIQPGTVSEHISAFYDVKPTFAEVAGLDIKEECDGISFLPELLGEHQKAHKFLYWEFHGKQGTQAVRMGDWKGVRVKMGKDPDKAIELYNLKTDPQEKHNVAAEYPAIVKKISKIMSQEHVENPRFQFDYEK